MSDEVTVSVAGSRLPPDPRSAAYRFQQQKRKSDRESPGDGDTLLVDMSQARYRDATASNRSDVEEAVSFSQTQAAFLGMVQRALDRLGKLSVLCQDATKSDADRAGFTVEFTQLQNFVSDIGAKKFNGVGLFEGATLSVGDETEGRRVPLTPINWSAPFPDQSLAVAYDCSVTEVTTQAGASVAVANIRKALENLVEMQSKVSTNLQRLSLSNEQLSVLNQNLSAANSRMNDIDWAKKLTESARFRILGEAGSARSTQANTNPQATIRLLEPNR
jgi:flagellin